MGQGGWGERLGWPSHPPLKIGRRAQKLGTGIAGQHETSRGHRAREQSSQVLLQC